MCEVIIIFLISGDMVMWAPEWCWPSQNSRHNQWLSKRRTDSCLAYVTDGIYQQLEEHSGIEEMPGNLLKARLGVLLPPLLLLLLSWAAYSTEPGPVWWCVCLHLPKWASLSPWPLLPTTTKERLASLHFSPPPPLHLLPILHVPELQVLFWFVPLWYQFCCHVYVYDNMFFSWLCFCCYYPEYFTEFDFTLLKKELITETCFSSTLINSLNSTCLSFLQLLFQRFSVIFFCILIS